MGKNPERGYWIPCEDGEAFVLAFSDALKSLGASDREIEQLVRENRNTCIYIWNINRIAKKELDGMRELKAYNKAIVVFLRSGIGLK